ncbi:unnamed protein product [Prunus brigantina]
MIFPYRVSLMLIGLVPLMIDDPPQVLVYSSVLTSLHGLPRNSLLSLTLVLKPNIGLLPILLPKFDGLVTCFVNLAFPFALLRASMLTTFSHSTWLPILFSMLALSILRLTITLFAN